MNKHGRLHRLKRYFFTGLFIVVPAWGTFLILSALFMDAGWTVGDFAGDRDDV